VTWSGADVGPFMLPASAREILEKEVGDAEFHVDREGSRSRVRIRTNDGRWILDHRATDRLTRPVSSQTAQVITSTRVPASVVAKTLRTAVGFVKVGDAYLDSQRAVRFAPTPSSDCTRASSAVFACDAHSVIFIETEALGGASLLIPARALSTVLAFLRNASQFVHLEHRERSFVVMDDDARSAVGWPSEALLGHRFMAPPPPAKDVFAVTFERKALLAAIDRVASAIPLPPPRARIAFDPESGTLTLADSRGRCQESVSAAAIERAECFASFVELQSFRALFEWPSPNVTLRIVGPIRSDRCLFRTIQVTQVREGQSAPLDIATPAEIHRLTPSMV